MWMKQALDKRKSLRRHIAAIPKIFFTTF